MLAVVSLVGISVVMAIVVKSSKSPVMSSPFPSSLSLPMASIPSSSREGVVISMVVVAVPVGPVNKTFNELWVTTATGI